MCDVILLTNVVMVLSVISLGDYLANLNANLVENPDMYTRVHLCCLFLCLLALVLTINWINLSD